MYFEGAARQNLKKGYENVTFSYPGVWGKVLLNDSELDLRGKDTEHRLVDARFVDGAVIDGVNDGWDLCSEICRADHVIPR